MQSKGERGMTGNVSTRFGILFEAHDSVSISRKYILARVPGIPGFPVSKGIRVSAYVTVAVKVASTSGT